MMNNALGTLITARNDRGITSFSPMELRQTHWIIKMPDISEHSKEAIVGIKNITCINNVKVESYTNCKLSFQSRKKLVWHKAAQAVVCGLTVELLRTKKI